jgi:integrase/recombinase XerC
MTSRAYAQTRDLRAVQALLGHSKPETTARYTLVPDGALRDAIDAL